MFIYLTGNFVIFVFTLQERNHFCYANIASAISQIVEDPVEAYWITNRFYKSFKVNSIDLVPSMVRSFIICLDINVIHMFH